jgi:hypothetical protein
MLFHEFLTKGYPTPEISDSGCVHGEKARKTPKIKITDREFVKEG